MKDKYFIAALICWLICGIFVAVWFYLSSERWEHKTVNEPLFPQRSREQLRQRHHYHGINYSYQKPDGQWVFMRDGQECRLFAKKETDK